MAHINGKSFNWNDDIEKLDKPLWLSDVAAKIKYGDTTYKDAYLTSTLAYLAPDNYDNDYDDEGNLIINVSDNTQLQQAGKEFDKVISDMKDRFVWACQETDNISLIEQTAGWRLLDFISESEYQANKFDKTLNHRQFAMWRNVVIKGKQVLTYDMVCTQEHFSKYDIF